jgi:hypothetical protein
MFYLRLDDLRFAGLYSADTRDIATGGQFPVLMVESQDLPRSTEAAYL